MRRERKVKIFFLLHDAYPESDTLDVTTMKI